MLPWMGWRYFLFGDPGNGGPLLQPRGQTYVFYSVPPPLAPQAQQQQQQQPQEAQQQEAQPQDKAAGAEERGAERG